MTGRSIYSFSGVQTAETSYAIAGSPAAVTLKIDYYQKLDQLILPLAVSCGLGLD